MVFDDLYAKKCFNTVTDCNWTKILYDNDSHSTYTLLDRTVENMLLFYQNLSCFSIINNLFKKNNLLPNLSTILAKLLVAASYP